MEKQLQLDEELIRDKNYEKKFFGKKLRVYVDEEYDKYYVDTFAAFSLGIIDYRTASVLVDKGSIIFEITKETLEYLKRIFEGKIVYVTINTANKEKSINNPEFDNYFGDDLRDEYENYKLNNYNGDFEDYLKENNIINRDENYDIKL